MKTIMMTASITLLCLAGCITPLTPEELRDEGLAKLQTVSSAEEIIETVVEYDFPEVKDAAEKKLADKIDDLIICGAGEITPEWRGMDMMFTSVICREASRARSKRMWRYIEEERNNWRRPRGVSNEGAALERERKFIATSRNIGKNLILAHPERLTNKQVQKLYDGWDLNLDTINKIIQKENQKLAQSFYDTLVNIKYASDHSWEDRKFKRSAIKFSTVLAAYLKLDKATAKEKVGLLRAAITNWTNWKGDKDVEGAIVAEMRKDIQATAYSYLILTHGSENTVSDPDMGFAKAYFDENTWAEMYVDSGKNSSGCFSVFYCEPAYRKSIAGHVENPALIKKMLLQVSGFKISDDIGINDCLAKLSEIDVVDVAQNACDEDVRNIALKSVKDYNTLSDSIEAEKCAVAKVRNARVLIRLIEKNKEATEQQKSIVVKMKNIIKQEAEAIIATSKENVDKTFVLNGFYVGMTEDAAEILIGWYYPNAEVEQKTVDNSFFGATGPNHGDRYLSVDGVKFCDADKSGVVTRVTFTAKMLYDWLGIEDSNQLAWVEKFRSKFNLPEFTFHVEQKELEVLGFHKIETVGTYYYRHPNGWKVTHYGEKHNSVHGNVAGSRLHKSGDVAGGQLVLE